MQIKAIVLGVGLLVSGLARAVPSELTVQGVLRDSQGKLQTQAVNAVVTLYDAQTDGNVLAGPYNATGVQVTNGLFTIKLTDNGLKDKLKGAPQVWIEVSAGNDTFPRQPVTPNLFALLSQSADNATNADKLGGADAAEYLKKADANKGTVTSITASAPLSVTNGTTTPAISLASPLPIANGGTGSTTQNFVDLSSNQSIAGTKTFTGTVTLPGGYQRPLANNCSTGQYLQGFSATGTPSCVPATAGTVTNVTASAPLSVATGTTTPAISLGVVPAANGGLGNANSDGSSLKNLNGANLTAHSVPASAIATGELTHSHGLTVSLTPQKYTALDYNDGTGQKAGTAVLLCSTPCPSGSIAVGGSCRYSPYNDANTNVCQNNVNYRLMESYVSPGLDQYCCRATAATSSGNNCNLTAWAVCVSAPNITGQETQKSLQTGSSL